MTRKCSYIIKILKSLVLGEKYTKNDNFNSFPIDDIDYENIYIETSDNIKIGCWVLSPKFLNSKTDFVIALHGNNCSRLQFVKKYYLQRFVKLNYILLIPDYRGFGDSEGEFFVDLVNFDIEAVQLYCKNRFKKTPFIFGFSLGGAIALEYLRYSSFKNKIIILSGFSSLLDILNTRIIFKILKFFYPSIEQKIKKEFNFDGLEAIKSAKKNQIAIYHGSRDDLVPCWQGEKLAKVIDCNFFKLKNYDHFSAFFVGNVFIRFDRFFRNKKYF